MGTVTVTSFKAQSDGSYGSVDALLAFGSSYNNTGNNATTGETITAAALGAAQIIGLTTGGDDSGYSFELLGADSGPTTSARLKVYYTASGSTGAEAAHTHAVLLDAGTSAAGSAHSHTFTASNPSSVDNATVTYDASPGGNIVYLKFMNDGSPYLACNMATTTTNKMITFGTSTKVLIVHDASAASGGTAVKIDSAQGDASERIRCDLSTTFNEDVYIKAINGNVVRVKNSGTGTNLYFDDGVDQRLESAVASTANVNIGSYAVKVWLAGAATGTTATESSHTHGPGTLADTASGAGSSHLHSTGAAAAAEVANGTDLSTALASVKVTFRVY